MRKKKEIGNNIFLSSSQSLYPEVIITMHHSVAYESIAVAVHGIWVLPLFILWCISLCLARRRGDPARVGVAWAKAAFPFFIL